MAERGCQRARGRGMLGLCEWIPARIKAHIEKRLGVVPLLSNAATRVAYAEDKERFVLLIRQQIDKTAANFEIFSFAVIKVHLERFACKVYGDTRTSAHDGGVDLSTNLGVVYHVKKLRVHTESEAERIYAELKVNFACERLQDGNVILVIDDRGKNFRAPSHANEEIFYYPAIYHGLKI